MRAIELAPDAELVVTEATVVEMLYDPLRYRLFRLLREPRSVPELAAEVGVPANRLYYHVRRLVRSGLVRQVGARAVGKGTERIYSVTAERISFSGDLTLPGAGARGEGPLQGITAELEAAFRAHEAGELGEAPALLSYHFVRLTPSRARQLETRLQALAAEFDDDARSAHARRYALLSVLAPLPESKT
jgi:DNA-binding Lrp family transcriptional regulator